VSREGQIAQLVEKDLQTKLGLLFKKNFYDVAVKIARNSQYDKVGCAFNTFRYFLGTKPCFSFFWFLFSMLEFLLVYHKSQSATALALNNVGAARLSC
jgi:hypothetical protein